MVLVLWTAERSCNHLGCGTPRHTGGGNAGHLTSHSHALRVYFGGVWQACTDCRRSALPG